MPKTKISEFSATPANNTDIDSINIAENCPPSGINDAIRELMAQLKDFQTGAVGDSFNGPVGTTTAAAGAFTTLSSTGNTTLGDASGDSVTINGTATFANANPTLSAGTANGVTYLNGSKVVTSSSALTFDGTNFATTGTGTFVSATATAIGLTVKGRSTDNISKIAFTSNAGSTEYGSVLASASEIRLNNATSDLLTFYTNNSEQMRLTSTGLGIGTSSVSYGASGRGNLTLGGSASGILGFQIGGVAKGYVGHFDSNMQIWNDANSPILFATNSAERMRLDSSGRLGLGMTPSGSYSLQIYGVGSAGSGSARIRLNNSSTGTADADGGGIAMEGVDLVIQNSENGVCKWEINGSERARITSSGNLLVGTTTILQSAEKIAVLDTSNNNALLAKQEGGNTGWCGKFWNNSTTGDNKFIEFTTETAITARGSVTYNRAGGLTVYNTTSDYRAKDIIGSVTNSGSVIDSVPVYMGKMHGATQERPMFIAHETPSYAHTGVKDAVDEDGNPVYQQMDASALIPVMWAEIQSLRKRLADANL